MQSLSPGLQFWKELSFMKGTFVLLALLIGGAIQAGASKSYVDPSYGKVQYADILKPAQPYRLKLKVNFQLNGKPHPGAEKQLMQQVDRVIRASGFAVPVPEGEAATDELHVVVNNVADIGEAKRKGFVTGSTFFLKGSTVTDYYEMEATAVIGGKTIAKSGYKHAIHSTIGLAKGPKDIQGTTADEAFGKVVEELILNFLGDLQKEDLSRAVAAPVAPPNPVAALAVQASLTVDSTPAGADIEIDGTFVGNTPSTVGVAPGSHLVAVKAKGFADWSKTLNVSGGAIHVSAELERASQ
jgi:hypothetical protein